MAAVALLLAAPLSLARAASPAGPAPLPPARTHGPRRSLQTITLSPLSCGASTSGSTYGRPDAVGQPVGEAWFSFASPLTGAVRWSSCGSSFDTFLRVYDAAFTPLAACDDGPLERAGKMLSCEACASSNVQPVLTFEAREGVEYYLALEGYDAEGSFRTSLECEAYASPPPAPPLPPSVPRCVVALDLVLVLDHSGSMDTGSVVADVRQLGLSLLDQFELAAGVARMAVVEFNAAASTVQALTSDRKPIRDAIGQYAYPSGGTNMAAGMRRAKELLDAGGRVCTGFSCVVMILSDGEQSAEYGGSAAAISEAQVLKAAGILLFAVGFGAVTADTLDAIASSPPSKFSYLGSDIDAISAQFADFCSAIASPQPPPSPLPPGVYQSPRPPPAPPRSPTPSPPPPLPAVPPTPADLITFYSSYMNAPCALSPAGGGLFRMTCEQTHARPMCFSRVRVSAATFRFDAPWGDVCQAEDDYLGCASSVAFSQFTAVDAGSGLSYLTIGTGAGAKPTLASRAASAVAIPAFSSARAAAAFAMHSTAASSTASPTLAVTTATDAAAAGAPASITVAKQSSSTSLPFPLPPTQPSGSSPTISIPFPSTPTAPPSLPWVPRPTEQPSRAAVGAPAKAVAAAPKPVASTAKPTHSAAISTRTTAIACVALAHTSTPPSPATPAAATPAAPAAPASSTTLPSAVACPKPACPELSSFSYVAVPLSASTTKCSSQNVSATPKSSSTHDSSTVALTTSPTVAESSSSCATPALHAASAPTTSPTPATPTPTKSTPAQKASTTNSTIAATSATSYAANTAIRAGPTSSFTSSFTTPLPCYLSSIAAVAAPSTPSPPPPAPPPMAESLVSITLYSADATPLRLAGPAMVKAAPDVQLSRVGACFCRWAGVPVELVQLYLRGQQLRPSHSLLEAGLASGHAIDARLTAQGVALREGAAAAPFALLDVLESELLCLSEIESAGMCRLVARLSDWTAAPMPPEASRPPSVPHDPAAVDRFHRELLSRYPQRASASSAAAEAAAASERGSDASAGSTRAPRPPSSPPADGRATSRSDALRQLPVEIGEPHQHARGVRLCRPCFADLSLEEEYREAAYSLQRRAIAAAAAAAAAADGALCLAELLRRGAPHAAHACLRALSCGCVAAAAARLACRRGLPHRHAMRAALLLLAALVLPVPLRGGAALGEAEPGEYGVELPDESFKLMATYLLAYAIFIPVFPIRWVAPTMMGLTVFELVASLAVASYAQPSSREQ
ncbi:hypothetical protein AB1Y20_013869 [Prymnesium parvum]|uniref:VWFA domain-containing protein n=2 Tax=Prymnesium parvum TaxID=97485 RepID=A0AB34IFP2_PRYPA